MEKLVRASLVLALGAAMACGDDDGSSDTGTADTGPADTATGDTGAADTGTDAMVPTTSVTFLFTDSEETPLADVETAVDTAAGRVEGTSDASGMLTIDIPAEMDDLVTFTHALEGYTIVSFVDVPLDRFLMRVGDPAEITLPSLAPSGGGRTDFTIMATGVPSGGKLCAAHGNGDRSWALCAEPDSAWNYIIPTNAIGDEVNVWAVDDTATPVDFAVVPIPMGETTVTVDFDGSFETAPETRSVRLDFPDDPESPLVTATELPPRWFGWFALSVRETNRMWSLAYNPRLDGSDLLVDVMIMTPPAGSELSYNAAAWSQLRGVHSVSFANFMADPGDTVTMMGFPRITGGAALADTFTIDTPAAAGGDELLHSITFRNTGGNVWRVVSGSSSIQAPELPSEYDTDVSFPFPGAPGVAVAQSNTLLETNDLVPGVDLDFRSSFSPPVDITF